MYGRQETCCPVPCIQSKLRRCGAEAGLEPGDASCDPSLTSCFLWIRPLASRYPVRLISPYVEKFVSFWLATLGPRVRRQPRSSSALCTGARASRTNGIPARIRERSPEAMGGKCSVLRLDRC
jgi:hypothetical protein